MAVAIFADQPLAGFGAQQGIDEIVRLVRMRRILVHHGAADPGERALLRVREFHRNALALEYDGRGVPGHRGHELAGRERLLQSGLIVGVGPN